MMLRLRTNFILVLDLIVVQDCRPFLNESELPMAMAKSLQVRYVCEKKTIVLDVTRGAQEQLPSYLAKQAVAVSSDNELLSLLLVSVVAFLLFFCVFFLCF